MAAMAAGLALLWKGSGRLRQATRTLPEYSFMIWSTVGSTREQNGHWKSENWTMVTRASLAPLMGAPAMSALYTSVGRGSPALASSLRGAALTRPSLMRAA